MKLHLVFHVLQVVFPFSCQVFCHLIRRYPRQCVFAFEYFVFLGRVINPSAKPPFLEDQFFSLSLASLLRPVRLGRPYQEHKVPAGIARKVIEARKLPHHDKVETIGGEIYIYINMLWIYKLINSFTKHFYAKIFQKCTQYYISYFITSTKIVTAPSINFLYANYVGTFADSFIAYLQSKWLHKFILPNIR
jgi:hypothetical protein